MKSARPKIVVIGGGTGIFSVLSGLKEHPVKLSAIVSMADSGGSTGQLREEFGALPPGDVRMALVALSKSRRILSELFNYRFNGQSLNHSFGNLFLVALADLKGNFAAGVHEAARILGARGRVLPVTLDQVHLMAELENGQVIKGETNIDCPQHDGSLKIKRVFYNQSCSLNPEAQQALQEADLIIIGPGDLFTSIIPNLLVPGMKEAIKESRAHKVYFGNIMTKFGETNDFSGYDFVSTLEQYLFEDVFDWVVFNKTKPDPKRVIDYEKEKAEVVEYSLADFKDRHAQIWERDLLRPAGFVRHDAAKAAKVVMEIIDRING
jgi:uncharacterized cofD-like protein